MIPLNESEILNLRWLKTMKELSKIKNKKHRNNMQQLIKELLIKLGLDLTEPNLADTPKRVEGALKYALRGHTKEAQDEIERRFKTKFPTKYKGMVVQKKIFVNSICPHHLKDINYEIAFGICYKKEALGLSMIFRIIKLLSARAVLQEDLTTDIIELFKKNLDPKGIAVVIKGHHNCMRTRGIEQDIPTYTSELTGCFYNDLKTREEFFHHIE